MARLGHEAIAVDVAVLSRVVITAPALHHRIAQTGRVLVIAQLRNLSLKLQTRIGGKKWRVSPGLRGKVVQRAAMELLNDCAPVDVEGCMWWH